MKLIATTVLCASALLGFSETFETKATEGEVLVRTFSFSSESSMEDVSVTMNGEDGPGGPGDMEQESSFHIEYEVRDTNTKVSDGQVESVERLYSKIESSRSEHMVQPMSEEPMDMESTGESDLKDKTVVLEAKGDETVASWAEGEEGDEDLLKDLAICEDFSALLPAGAQELEGTWSISPSLLDLLNEPLGDLHLSDDGMPEEMEEGDVEMPDEEFEGEIQATFAEIVEEDDRRLARVTFTVDVSSTVDLTDFFAAMTDAHGGDVPEDAMIPEVESMENESSYVGEGTFLWDLKNGRLASLELTCETTTVETMILLISMGQEEMEIEQITEHAGTDTWKIEFASGK